MKSRSYANLALESLEKLLGLYFLHIGDILRMFSEELFDFLFTF